MLTVLEAEQKIREATKTARKFFALNLPLTMEALKSQFRERAKALHPDMTGTQDTGHAFDDLKKAFDALIELEGLPGVFSLNGANGQHQESKPQFTCDGTLLAELGKGLGRTKNGKTCEVCDGRGYTETTRHDWETCSQCSGRGVIPKVYPCRVCGGSGKYRLRGGRRVDCLTCGGTGKFTHPFQERLCTACGGLGRSYTRAVKRVYEKCFRCGGTGQTSMFNPVIIKDGLGGAIAKVATTHQ